MSFPSLMNSSMTVDRVTRTSDGHGGSTPSWAALYTNAPCRLQPMSGEEQIIYDREGVPSTHKLFCETVYSFTEDDRITINSLIYDVTLVRDIDLLTHHQEVNLRRVKPGI